MTDEKHYHACTDPGCLQPATENLLRIGRHIAKLSGWIDDWPPNATRDTEALTWMRLAKIAEESGEVITKYIAVTRGNPRKDHWAPVRISEVMTELLDVALSALAAYEHMEGAHGTCLTKFVEHLNGRMARVGLCLDP